MLGINKPNVGLGFNIAIGFFLFGLLLAIIMMVVGGRASLS